MTHYQEQLDALELKFKIMKDLIVALSERIARLESKKNK